MIIKKAQDNMSSSTSHISSLVCLIFSYVAFDFSDIDECALPTGGHICSYRCHNTPGSFHCSCPINGYTLAPNGRSCQGERGSRQHHTLTCWLILVIQQDFDDLGFCCFFCFFLADVDECLTGTHTCAENQSCFNIQGGFRCLSFECPNNYRRVGET